MLAAIKDISEVYTAGIYPHAQFYFHILNERVLIIRKTSKNRPFLSTFFTYPRFLTSRRNGSQYFQTILIGLYFHDEQLFKNVKVYEVYPRKRSYYSAKSWNILRYTKKQERNKTATQIKLPLPMCLFSME